MTVARKVTEPRTKSQKQVPIGRRSPLIYTHIHRCVGECVGVLRVDCHVVCSAAGSSAKKKKKQERKGKLKWIKQILVCLTIIVVVRVIKTVNRIIKFKWTKRLESGARKLSI